MNATINKEFIFNYLAGKSTALQKQWVDEWVKDPAHEELFYQWLVEYEYQQPQYLTNVDGALGRFNEWADGKDTDPTTEIAAENTPTPRRYWTWRVAASILVAFVVSGVLFKNTILYQTHVSAYGETRTLILEDGTRVMLNANSSLRVPRFGFGHQTREVLLKGEANFDVAHKVDNQRFIVKTVEGLEVVVLGTEFTVYARSRKSRVILNRGKVQLRYREGEAQKEVLMKPGDLVTLDQDHHLEHKAAKPPEEYAAWKDHRFVFDDTTLAEFAEMMQESYGIQVVIEDGRLARRTLVGSFRAESPDELLEIVCRLFNLKMSKSGEVVRLAAEG